MQPMIEICAAILQSARSEFTASPCSMEFHENIELALRAEPYCKFFNKEFVTSVTDIEMQADTWCGKAECETSVEELAEIEKECMDVAIEKPAELLMYVNQTMPKFAPNWVASGCLPKVCTTL